MFKLGGQIDKINSGLLSGDPVNEYIKLLDQYPQYVGYKHRSERLNRFCDSLLSGGDLAMLESFHKMLLLQLIRRSQRKVERLILPDSVKHYYHEDFKRILAAIEHDESPKGYYQYSNDRFNKDLAICRLHLFPIGARKYEMSKFPIKRFIGKGWKQFIKISLFLIFKTRGIAPFLTGHYDTVDPKFLKSFNAEGSIMAYRILTEVMKLNPSIKGYYAISWFDDPQLERISPHLAYIRYMNVAMGSKNFCLGTNAAAVGNATAKSKHRRKLFQEGKYIPQNYAFVYSRKKMLAWADSDEWYW